MVTRELKKIKVIKREIEILPKQREFLQATEKLLIYRGSIRSGKTYVGAIKTALHCQDGETILSLSPTYQMAVSNVAETLEEVCELLQIPCKISMSKKEAYIGKGKVIFRTGESPDAIRGFAADRMWIDEASFFKNKDAYLRGYGRLSKNPKRQVYITSSPNSKDWVYKLTKTSKSVRLITQALIDNYFLDEDFFNTLLDEYGGDDSPFARQELYGEIVNFNEAYFPVSRIKYSDNIRLQSVCQAFDLGYTKGAKSDYSAYAICGIDYDNNFVVMHVERWKFETPATKEKIKELAGELGESVPVLIEANGTQVSVYQDLSISPELQDYQLIPVGTVSSKPTRSMGLSTAMQSGRVVFNEAPWNELAKEEIEEFTYDDTHEHDDMVDAIVMCYNYLKHGNATLGRKRV